MTDVRVPPQDLDTERALFGAIMLNPSAMYEIADLLSPDSFYAAKHKTIYEAMAGLFARGEPVDLVSLSARLKEKKGLDKAGGRPPFPPGPRRPPVPPSPPPPLRAGDTGKRRPAQSHHHRRRDRSAGLSGRARYRRSTQRRAGKDIPHREYRRDTQIHRPPDRTPRDVGARGAPEPVQR